MSEEKDLKGYRIYLLDPVTRIPKEIMSGDDSDLCEVMLDKLEFENNTYAIRVGKEGLK